jgi:hypothetical protein
MILSLTTSMIGTMMVVVVAGGGWWWLVVAGGGWWWLVVAGGGWWWLVVAGGGCSSIQRLPGQSAHKVCIRGQKDKLLGMLDNMANCKN